MLSVKVEAKFSTLEPDADIGLITWWNVSITREAFDDAGAQVEVGSIRAATIHYGEAMNVGEPLHDILDADSGELEALHEVFFNDGSLQDKFDGAEEGLLYVASVDVPDIWRQRGADLAVVRRLGDVLGMGCALVVLAPDEHDHQARWAQIGFAPAAQRGRGSTYLYLNRSYNHPRVVEVRGEDRFEVHPPHDVEVVGD